MKAGDIRLADALLELDCEAEEARQRQFWLKQLTLPKTYHRAKAARIVLVVQHGFEDN